MASPSSVLTLGLGSWGDANELLTLGYGSGAAAPTVPSGPVNGTLSIAPVLSGTLYLGDSSTVAAKILYINEDNQVTLDGLSYVNSSGSTVYLNAATVTYALYTASGTAISGGTGTLDYVAASNGKYTGVVESTIASDSNLSQGERYYLAVPIAEGTRNGYRRLHVIAEFRGED